jgi:hypothetical protein
VADGAIVIGAIDDLHEYQTLRAPTTSWGA